MKRRRRYGAFPWHGKGLAVIGITAALVALVAAAMAFPAWAIASPPNPAVVAGTPCTTTTRSCVDLVARRAWLIRNGQIIRGPVAIDPGGDGRQTPVGTFTVQWKQRNYRIAKLANAPTSYSIFFGPGDIAFHTGDPATAS